MRAQDLTPLVQVTRGDLVESIHHGAAAVVDSEGELLAHWGDPDLVTFLRSSAKPLQLLPLLEKGGAERFELAEEEIALMCASHVGSDRHVQGVLRLHARLGLEASHLLCGPALPADQEARARFVYQALPPDPLRHNCSGKHTAMLALAKLMGVDPADYIDPAHPVQREIRAAVAEMCGLEGDEIPGAVDGCSVPTFAVPLRAAAFAYARLADGRGLDGVRAAACSRIFKAMTACPQMVAGEGRFDTELMRQAGGRILSKGGAEGYLTLGIARGALAPDSPGLGIAIKIADGDMRGRARSVLAVKLLLEMGLLRDEQAGALAGFGPGPLRNARGVEVGAIEPMENLRWER